LELAGFGGVFTATEDIRIALTGAVMRATLDGAPLRWNAAHLLRAGAALNIGAAETGNYGYLSLGGGIATPMRLGARSAHIGAGVGGPVAAGDELPVAPDASGRVGVLIEPVDRFEPKTLRITQGVHAGLFSDELLARFEATVFSRDLRGNRMGVKMNFEGEGFAPPDARSIVSEIVMPGDIQITGDGTPYMLMMECQSMGGYPRIGTLPPSEIAAFAQARAGAPLRFRFVGVEEGIEVERARRAELAKLSHRVRPLVRRPEDIPDLLSYQFVSGVVNAQTGDMS
ncbi:MAG: biotin-dependent carboxyltransferase family protein, partial [Pikeienuella sp.]